MKLDATVMRTMSSQDFRVLEAVERGMKNHALVPMPLVTSIANLRHGGVHKIISSLLRDKLLSHERTKNGYDGYRLTNAGYDILALHNIKSRGFILALGQRIGTGKESDIYLASDPEGKQIVLKFHRLGRTSFRNVKKKRDYFGKKQLQTNSWLFLSRLSALKEYAFMKALHDVNYPTPNPLAHNRHIVAMSLVRGMPLYQIYPQNVSADQAQSIYTQAVGLATRLAKHGLVHCDLNEFNLLVDMSGIQSLATDAEDPYVRHSGMSVAGEKSLGLLSKPAWEQSMEAGDRIAEAVPEPIARLENGEPKPVVTLIDFPQMISTKHPNAEELYDRDIACLRRFFEMKLKCVIPEDEASITPFQLLVATENSNDHQLDAEQRLDQELRASGYSDDLNKDLELYYFKSGPTRIDTVVGEDSEEEEEEEEDDDNEELESGSVQSQNEQIEVDEESHHSVKSDDDAPNSEEPNEFESVPNQSNDTSFDLDEMYSMTRDQLEAKVKERVRRQLENEKRKSRKSGAFRKSNSNKTYVKGKRIIADSGF